MRPSGQDEEDSSASNLGSLTPPSSPLLPDLSVHDPDALALPAGISRGAACRARITAPPGGSSWAAMVWTMLRIRGAGDRDLRSWNLPDPAGPERMGNPAVCAEFLRSLGPILADHLRFRFGSVAVGRCGDLPRPMFGAFESGGPILLARPRRSDEPSAADGWEPFVGFQVGFDARGSYLCCISADPGDERTRTVRLSILDDQEWMTIVPCWHRFGAR